MARDLRNTLEILEKLSRELIKNFPAAELVERDGRPVRYDINQDFMVCLRTKDNDRFDPQYACVSVPLDVKVSVEDFIERFGAAGQRLQEYAA